MNGVARGGFYSTSQVLNVRCGGLRWERVRTYAGDRVGFRIVNGEYRGSQSLARAFLTRSAGFRWSGTHRNVGEDLGFRCEWC